MRCAIWYHLHNLKNMKNTHGGVLYLVKLQASATKSNTPPWVFFVFQTVKMVPNRATHHICNFCNESSGQCSYFITPDFTTFYTKGFLAFSGGIKWENWSEMG